MIAMMTMSRGGASCCYFGCSWWLTIPQLILIADDCQSPLIATETSWDVRNNDPLVLFIISSLRGGHEIMSDDAKVAIKYKIINDR